MKSKRDYYAVLGIGKNATEAKIKSAYRQLARKYHPDQNLDNIKEAQDKFNEVKEAYETLSDPKKRADYDQSGAHSSSRDTKSSRSDYNPASSSQKPDSFDFDELFGSGFARYFDEKMGTGEKGVADSDVIVNMQITYNESVSGAKKELRFAFSEVCAECSGVGTTTVAKGICKQCGGSGMEQVVSSGGGFGKISRKRQCSTCHGTGMQGNCQKCFGSGFVKINKKIIVEIPKGIKSGQNITMNGLGKPGKYGESRGNLIVCISVR